MGSERPRSRSERGSSSSSRSSLSRSRHKTKKDEADALGRRTSVEESLTKFLDDEDSFLVSDLVEPRNRKQSSSRSNHSSRSHRSSDGHRRSKSDHSRNHKSRSSRPERSQSDHGHSRRGGSSHSSSHSRSSRKKSSSRGEKAHRSKSEHSSRSHGRIQQSSFGTLHEAENEDDDYASDDNSFAEERTPRPPRRAQSYDPSHYRDKSSRSPSSSHSQQNDQAQYDDEQYDSFGEEDIPRPTLSPRRATSDVTGMGFSLDRQLERANRISNERDARRANFKKAYRDASSVVSGWNGDDRTTVTTATSFTSASSMSRATSRGGRKTNVDGGPLSHLLNPDRHLQQRKMTLGSHFAENAEDEDEKSMEEQSVMSEQWVEQRSRNQDAILNQAKQDRWEKEAHDEEELRRGSVSHISDFTDEGGEVFDGDDDDQPRMKGKSNPFDEFYRTIRRTTKVTRSAAKGSVNAVKDPTRAAKRVGGLTKSVGKGAVNAVLDPTKTAKRVGKVTKTGVFGTVNIATGVTAFTAKAGFVATKAVAKTGMGATTMVVGATTDGLGKVVHGVHGLVRGGHNDEDGDQFEDYNARNLPERQTQSQSLMDRITSVVEETKIEEPDVSQPVAGDTEEDERAIKKKSMDDKAFKKSMARRKKGLSAGSMLVPITTDVGRRGSASWDVTRPEY